MDNGSGRTRELVRAALERSPSERAAFLTTACAGDEALLAEAERLLAEEESQATAVFGAGGGTARTVGAYRLEEQLGAGGMGEVWAATDQRLGRRVAIKFLPAAVTGDASRVARFQNEARAASALNHPNILTVHELGQTESAHYIVTELVEGTTLRGRLSGGRLPMPEVIDVAAQIASALAASHAAGVVHRDVKPENIMIRADGLVKVLDFGLAKLLEPSNPDHPRHLITREGTVVGTPGYMSPEQLRGTPVDQRTDVWSLGVVIYEMAAGRRPFVAGDPSGLAAMILRDDPLPVGSAAGDVPPRLEALLRKALSKDRDQRHASARELLDELRAVERDLVSPPPRARRSKRGIAAVVLLGATLAIGATALVIRREPAAAVPAQPSTIRSIAVLPFANLSGAAENEYLSDGMTDELIHALGKVQGLSVVSRTSSFAMKGTSSDARAVARRLGVGAVVEGSVRKSGNRLRVTAQLVSGGDGYQMWSEVYDRELTDVFAIQQEIAASVANALAAAVGSKPLVTVGTRSVQAYELYLKGRQSAQRNDDAGYLDRAIAYYRDALARDPAYAAAWSGLADAYSMLDHRSGLTTLDPVQTYALAREAANRALALDNELSEAWAALGHIQVHLGEFAEAEQNLRRAVELNPSSGTARQWYAMLFRAFERPEETREQLFKAFQLDPLSTQLAGMGATGLWAVGDYAGAIEFARRGIEVTPDYPRHYIALARGLAFAGRIAEAEAALEKAASFPRPLKVLPGERALVLAVSGRKSEALELLRSWKESMGTATTVPDFTLPLYRALAAAGEIDEAARALQQSVELNPYYCRVNIGLPRHPVFETMIADPRYGEVRRGLGLE